MSSYILENLLLFKTSFIIGQFLLFFASEEEKKSYKKFSDGIERFIWGLQFDKIAPNEHNSTKIDKKIAIHTQSTQACDPLNIKLQSC